MLRLSFCSCCCDKVPCTKAAVAGKMDCLAYSFSLHFIIAGKLRQEPEAAGHNHRQEQRQNVRTHAHCSSLATIQDPNQARHGTTPAGWGFPT